MFQASHVVFKFAVIEVFGTHPRAGWHIWMLQLGVAAPQLARRTNSTKSLSTHSFLSHCMMSTWYSLLTYTPKYEYDMGLR